MPIGPILPIIQKRVLAPLLSFSISAGPLASGDIAKTPVNPDNNPPNVPELLSLKSPTAKAVSADPLQQWIDGLIAEITPPTPAANLSSLLLPPVLPLFPISSPSTKHTNTAPQQASTWVQKIPGATIRTAKKALRELGKGNFIDPDTQKIVLEDIKSGKAPPAKIIEMANAIEKFYRGEVGKTLSKVEIQAAAWLGYVAGNAGSGKEPLVRGPEGVIGYLRGMDERVEELRKGNDIVIDPRGRKGFREYYLSKGVPAVLRLKEEGLVDSVPRSVQLTLSLPKRPWTERIRKLIETGPGECVTAVILTLAANNIPNPFATSLEEGNNPAGLAAQLPKFGYKSLNPLDGKDKAVKMKTNYGEVELTILTPQDFVKAAYLGKIPTYSVVFQTRHESWVKPSTGSEAVSPATSPKSRGFDAAMAIPSFDDREPFDLWNGRRNGLLIYGGATRWVFVLTPHRHGLKHGDPIQELLLAARERDRQGKESAV